MKPTAIKSIDNIIAELNCQTPGTLRSVSIHEYSDNNYELDIRMNGTTPSIDDITPIQTWDNIAQMRYTRTFDSIAFRVTVEVCDNKFVVGGINDRWWITPEEVADTLGNITQARTVLIAGVNGTSINDRLKYFRFIGVTIGADGWDNLKNFHILAEEPKQRGGDK